MTLRERPALLAWIPPALLLGVAATQLVLAATADLSPWKGGGFGMFSSTDHGPSRSVRVVLLTPDGEIEPRLPQRLRLLVAKAEHGPVAPLLARLARAAAADAAEEGLEVLGARVSVYRVAYGARWLEPRASLLRELTVDVAPAGD